MKPVLSFADTTDCFTIDRNGRFGEDYQATAECSTERKREANLFVRCGPLIPDLKANVPEFVA
jgi:hypothetical protein